MTLSKGFVAILTALIGGVATIAGAWIGAQKGVVSFPNPALDQQVAELRQRLENRSRLSGDFEWQWAGDAWLGGITFTNLSSGTVTAKADVRAIKYDNVGERIHVADIPEFRSDIDGSVTVKGGSTLLLHLPVQLTPQYLKKHHLVSRHAELDAELHPVDAFAGRVRYIGDKTTEGDMILVRYHSDVRRW